MNRQLKAPHLLSPAVKRSLVLTAAGMTALFFSAGCLTTRQNVPLPPEGKKPDAPVKEPGKLPAKELADAEETLNRISERKADPAQFDESFFQDYFAPDDNFAGGKTGGPKKGAKQKKGKPGKPCFYSGGVAVRQVTGKGRNKRYSTVLQGNATVRCDTTTLKSRKIEMQGKKGNKIKLHDGVNILDTQNNTLITGGYGIYFKKSRRAYLENNPVIVHTDPDTKEKTTITCLYLRRDFESKVSFCLGNVHVRREDWQARAGRAAYDEKSKRVTLEELPVIFRDGEYYSADTVHMQSKTPKTESYLLLEKQARLVTTREYNQAEKAPPKDGPADGAADTGTENILRGVQTVMKAGSIRRYTTKGKERSIAMRGERQVELIRKTVEMRADRIETEGPKNEIIRGYESISMWDNAEAVMIKGDSFEYFQQKDWAYVPDYPLVYLIHPAAEMVNARVECNRLERRFSDKNILFKGKVRMSHYDINRANYTFDENGELVKAPTYNWNSNEAMPYLSLAGALTAVAVFEFEPPGNELTATSEHATYREEDHMMVLEGQPALLQNNSTIYSSKILFEPRINRIKLVGGIKGQLTEN